MDRVLKYPVGVVPGISGEEDPALWVSEDGVWRERERGGATVDVPLKQLHPKTSGVRASSGIFGEDTIHPIMVLECTGRKITGWCTSVISVFRRLKQDNRQFEASVGCTMRPSQKQNTT